MSESESHCDWRSVTQSVLGSSPDWGSWPDIFYCLTVTVLSLGGRPLWREDVSVDCQSQSAVLRQLSLCTVIYILHVLHDIKIYTWPLSVRAQYSRLCPISGSFRYYGSLDTWTVVCLTVTKFKPLVFFVTGFALSNFFLIRIVGGGAQTGSNRHVGHLLAYCTCLDFFTINTLLKYICVTIQNLIFVFHYFCMKFARVPLIILRQCIFLCLSECFYIFVNQQSNKQLTTTFVSTKFI
jgi:hypothetical protein